MIISTVEKIILISTLVTAGAPDLSLAELTSKRNAKIQKHTAQDTATWGDWFGSLLGGRREVSVDCNGGADILILHEASRQAAQHKDAIENFLPTALEETFPIKNATYYLSTFQDKSYTNTTKHCYKSRVKQAHHVAPIADSITYLPHLANFKNYTANTLEGIANAVLRAGETSDNWGHNGDQAKIIVVLAASAPKEARDLDGKLRRRHRKWPTEGLASHDLGRLCAKYDYPTTRAIAPIVFGSNTYVFFVVLPSVQQAAVYQAFQDVARKLYQSPDSVQLLSEVDDDEAWQRAFKALATAYTAQVCTS
eukprot:Blabericola_migrator_1__6149@NODE_30_length_19081_cov_136_854686_g26_i0_p7_GENE_NODE_30_length_19081_cov_136_854686_g26_i0NODE_30_length_19081_cov_136_854686_g26_i0_p7_ORF_typecomplete_len309_score47_27Integrin_beta/PF00362_18/4_7e06_NODE_30_length_19081_cov_136_854686_g26_i01489115817